MNKKYEKKNPATVVKNLALSCHLALPILQQAFDNQATPIKERLIAGNAIYAINQSIIIAQENGFKV